MKLFQIVSVLIGIVSVLFVLPSAFAIIQFYGADTDLSDNGDASIKLIITFQDPVKEFQLAIFGVIRDFSASSNSGPVNCETEVGAASIISCQMNLTQEKRSLELRFKTNDFVKRIDSKSLFSLDLSLSQTIDLATSSVKLPEGYALTNTSQIPAILPPADTIVSDGRRIIINWVFSNLTTDQPFKFQTLYEPVKNEFPMLLLISGLLSFATLGGTGLFFYRRLKKPKEVILSVLDDYEKKIIELITVAGGEVNQRKIVIESNLSKAKVSRVVKRLQERGLLEVTRLGRTNKLKLSQKKFEGN